MNGKRDTWDYRDGIQSRISKIEAHTENIYHHVKRIDTLLEKQNGRIRTNEFTISKWKGVASGIIAISTAISTLIAMALKQENKMGLKQMLIAAAESQADAIKKQMMDELSSDEMSKAIATKINEKIDIPFVSEDKEQIFFEKCVDVVTDLIEGLLKGK